MSDGATLSELSQKPMVLEVSPALRWEVCYRLRSLGLSCQYRPNVPLTVRLDSPLAGIQCWCVCKQLKGTRAESIGWLQKCWHRGN